MDWSDQVAVVTGGSRGIGRAISRRLAARGAAVCVNYAARSAEAESIVAEIGAAGGRAIAVQADVADGGAVERMVARVTAEVGPISVLVNNAGVAVPTTLDAYDPTALERMRRVNADGVIHTVGAIAPGMRERRYGRIVNIASNAAIGTSLPSTTFYAASKAEVLILTRRFAMELGRSGITVNAVAPGWVVAEMARASRSDAEWEARLKMVSERSMVGRPGQPEDIAAAVSFWFHLMRGS
jgi:3-oxoacyl-[acyl-carrier protein] reductase